MEMILTTTDSVEGYVISQYLNCLSAAALYSPGGLIGEGYSNKKQSTMFDSAYRDALQRMSAQARNSADAIVGIRTSICSEGGGSILVTVTGTAVRLEKIVEPLPMTERAFREKRLKEEEERLAEKKRAREEERRERIERGEFLDVDIQLLVTELRKMDSAADMMEAVEDAAAHDPMLFPPDLLGKLRDSVEFGRRYGKRAGAQNFLNLLDQFLNQ